MDKTPDVAQLSTCCGKVLVWEYRSCEEPGCTCGSVWWDATCPMCGCLQCDRMPSAERHLTPVEEMLLARLAELEAAQRWRVPAEELPPVGEWVVGHYGGSEPCEVVQYDGDQWDFRALLDVNEPDFWLPIPAVPSKPGAS